MSLGPPPRWTFRHDRPEEARRLREEAGFAPLLAQILANREVSDPATARRFIDAPLADIRDPFDLPGTDDAAKRVAKAIADGEQITVYGDYDVDGICATSILTGLFKELGANADYYIPHRADEGYGLSCGAIDKLAAAGTQLLVTVDNGVTAIDEVEHARSLGVDVVVTDHHEPGNELPAACAVVNPKRRDQPYPHADFCGAGVAWKVAHAILREVGSDAVQGREFLMRQLDLVALATVADVVPLVGENRILARKGLTTIEQTRRVGLRALMNVAGVNGDVSTRSIAFQIAPRINAVGRTRSAMMGVELMLETDEANACARAGEFDALNMQRRTDEKELLKKVIADLDRVDEDYKRHAIVIWGDDWEIGLIGLIASRLCDQYNRPAFVLSVDRETGRAKGSSRSVPGFNLVEALQACSESLTEYGGHAMAAGLRMSAEGLEPFREAMSRYAEGRLTEDALRPELLIDAEAPLSELDLAAVEAIAKLEPFGEGNPRPLIAFPDVSLSSTPRVVGTNHLKLRLNQGGTHISAIGFGLGAFDSQLLRHQGSLRVVGHPTINDYQGRRTPEIEVKDIQLVD